MTNDALHSALKSELKQLIVSECDKDVDPSAIADDEPLFGEDSRLQLDSLDAIQLSVAIHQRYGIKLSKSKDVRRYFANVSALAGLLSAKQA